MRKIEDIQADIETAVGIQQAQKLMALAEEAESIGTSSAVALSLRARGAACLCTSEYTSANKHFSHALSIYESLQDRLNVALIKGNIGIVYYYLREHSTALEYSISALNLHEELADFKGIARVSGHIGNVFSDTGDFAAALDHYHRAITLYEELGDKRGIAVIVGNIGNVYAKRSEYSVALDHLQRALILHEELRDRSGVARVTGNIGNVYSNTGQYSKALTLYNTALDLHADLGELHECARINIHIGSILRRTADYPSAQNYYSRALDIYEELDDKGGVGDARGSIGNVLFHIGDYPAALANYRSALAVYEQFGERDGVALVACNIGNVHYITGNFPDALRFYHYSLSVYEEMGNQGGVARVVGNLGNVYRSTSEYPAALEQYQRAQSLYESIGEKSGIAIVTCNIGNVMGEIGNYSDALRHYHQALELHDLLGERNDMARVLNNISSTYSISGDSSNALEYAHRALQLCEELGDHAGLARAAGNVIIALLNLDRNNEASDMLERQASMQMTEPDVRARHEANSATLAERSDDFDVAQNFLMMALSITNEAGLRYASAEYNLKLRDLAQKRNDFASYIEHNNEYQRITEEINGKATAQKLAMMEAQKQIDAERQEKEKHRALLYNTLPPSIADRVLRGEQVNDSFVNAAVMFMDMVGFTTMSATMDPNDVVRMLSEVFTACDTIMNEHGLMKIKTIGDSYMAVAFPSESTSSEQRVASIEERAARAATAILLMMSDRFPQIRVRIGVHCGPVTAGVIGTERLQYDVWGDTVNVASRMESTGEPGRIHVSEAFASFLGLRPRNDSSSPESDERTSVIPNEVRNEEPGTWHLTLRGETELKGKGPMTTYWLEST